MNVVSGKITGSDIGANRDGQRNVRLLQAELTSPADLQIVEQISRSGEDNNPPIGTRAVIIQIGPAWKIAVADEDFVVPSAAPGEKYLYSTGTDGASIKSMIKLQNTGDISISNDTAAIELAADGNITMTAGQVTINSNVTINGVIDATDASLSGIGVVGHVHAILSGSSAPGPTDVMIDPAPESGP